MDIQRLSGDVFNIALWFDHILETIILRWKNDLDKLFNHWLGYLNGKT